MKTSLTVDGRLAIGLQAGASTVDIRFREPGTGRAGRLISLAALVVLALRSRTLRRMWNRRTVGGLDGT